MGLSASRARCMKKELPSAANNIYRYCFMLRNVHSRKDIQQVVRMNGTNRKSVCNGKKISIALKRCANLFCNSAIATEEELIAIENEARKSVNDEKRLAWDGYIGSVKRDVNAASAIIKEVADSSSQKVFIEKIISGMRRMKS